MRLGLIFNTNKDSRAAILDFDDFVLLDNDILTLYFPKDVDILKAMLCLL